jgi:hypothetical protein
VEKKNWCWVKDKDKHGFMGKKENPRGSNSDRKYVIQVRGTERSK